MELVDLLKMNVMPERTKVQKDLGQVYHPGEHFHLQDLDYCALRTKHILSEWQCNE